MRVNQVRHTVSRWFLFHSQLYEVDNLMIKYYPSFCLCTQNQYALNIYNRTNLYNADR